MSENNKRPPGYVPLTIHELAAGQKGKRGTAFDYVFSLDARAVDDSVLSSSAARAAVGPPRNGGRPHGEQREGGSYGGGRSDQNRGRRGNRRGRNNNRRDYGGQGGDSNGNGNWNESGGSDDGSSSQESGGEAPRAAAPQEEI